MISTKKIVTSSRDVPSYWAFEYYCNLTVKLTGQDEKITSPFNPNEKNPSFCLYVKDNRYHFKDFSSSDKSGNALELVKLLFNLTPAAAANKMLEDYTRYLSSSGADNRHLEESNRYRVTGNKIRSWNTLDAKYWSQYGIDSTTLHNFNVYPLEYYTMTKEGEDRIIKIDYQYLYGYFRSDGQIYKVYQPKSKDHKFIKVSNYIQGTDQLKFDKPNLVICSSLKDMMCLLKFGYNVEVVAPDSENSVISSAAMTVYKSKYPAVCTLFDYDTAGIAAMEKYKEIYNTPAVKLPLEKDLSDSVKEHGIEEVRKVLQPLLKEALKK
jgi:hypothetical protein